MRVALLLVAAYLSGAVPFGYLLVRWLRHTDVRTVGSGNVGATNALRAAGKGAALAVLALDATKGLLPVLAARALGEPASVQGMAALTAVLGHVYPITLGFRGGKGVATAAGAFLALSPAVLAAAAALFAVVLAAQRRVSVASLAAALACPLLLYAFGRAGWAPPPSLPLLATSGAISMLVIFKHRSNLERLRRGEEPRLGEGRGA